MTIIKKKKGNFLISHGIHLGLYSIMFRSSLSFMFLFMYFVDLNDDVKRILAVSIIVGHK